MFDSPIHPMAKARGISWMVFVNGYAKVTRPVTMKDVQDLIKARGGNPNDQFQIEQAQEQLEDEREERIRDFEKKYNVKY